MNGRTPLAGSGRFATDRARYRAMLNYRRVIGAVIDPVREG